MFLSLQSLGMAADSVLMSLAPASSSPNIEVGAEQDAHLACIIFSLSVTAILWLLLRLDGGNHEKCTLSKCFLSKTAPLSCSSLSRSTPYVSTAIPLWFILAASLSSSPGHPLITGVIVRAFISKPPAPRLQGAFVFPFLDITIGYVVF